MPNFPEEYKLPEGDLVKMRFSSLAEGDKKDASQGKWYKVNITAKDGTTKFFWSSMEVNAKLKEWNVEADEYFMAQKLEGWNKFHLEYDGKEAECGPPPRAGGGKGGFGGKGGSNWVKYSPQDLLKTMEWCKDKGGEDWKILFNGCCVSRTFLSPPKAADPAPQKSAAKADDDDSEVPF